MKGQVWGTRLPSRQVNSVKFDEPEYAEKIDLDYSRLLKEDEPV